MQVRSLTLRANKQTTHRRVPAAPQLKCISPRAICALHTVETMQCVNRGGSYSDEDIQWSCSASLPPELKLGSTDVVCEGYASADDAYVLKGSCGVEYRLVLTEEGERRFPDLGAGEGWWGGGLREGAGWSTWLFAIVFIAVAAWIIYGFVTAPRTGGGAPGAPRRPRNGWGGGGGWGPGGGGGGGGRWDDPPPPYPGWKPSSSSGAGWQPGFWSGLAGGAAAGYWAGNRGRNNEYNMGYGAGRSRNTWGGGGGPSSSRSSGSSSSSGSVSSSRYQSTGFGSTSRR